MARGCLITLDDVTSLTEANLMLMQSVKALEISAEKIRVQNDELQKHAHYDHLTGCINRRAFFDRGDPLFARMRETRGNLCCIMGDIDFFKSFNDRYGHAIGDLVIQQTASAMGRALRANDLLCRYGGEEFCILLLDADEETSSEIAERIRAIIESDAGPGVRYETPLKVTASLGMATLADSPQVESLTQLIDLADQALYVAKKSGRNRVAGTSGAILSAGVPPVQPVVAQAAAAAAH
jgi:diguanylate cyclase (GGDEF)-like protein